MIKKKNNLGIDFFHHISMYLSNYCDAILLPCDQARLRQAKASRAWKAATSARY